MDSRNIEQKDNFERDLLILLSNYFCFTTNETAIKVQEIMNLLYEEE